MMMILEIYIGNAEYKIHYYGLIKLQNTTFKKCLYNRVCGKSLFIGHQHSVL